MGAGVRAQQRGVEGTLPSAIKYAARACLCACAPDLLRPGCTPRGVALRARTHAGTQSTSVFSGKIAGCPVYLIRPADWNLCNIFRGTRIYGGSYNEMEAYLYFCRWVGWGGGGGEGGAGEVR